MEMCLDDQWKLSKKGNRRSAAVTPAASSPVGLKGRTSKGSGRSVPGRLASMAREQKARFYIMRRCVTMLVCWRD
ncbi:small polypeptide DEVIL 11-like [Lolium rigidum]|uniref:small polypeptide DEVIL 11-like n=1 Tax=Lolium rigidum TaxID=89674 RepID=UPI001F5E1B1D|nr:small polypeptide DEVIL 11-like [Lolium rigidum]